MAELWGAFDLAKAHTLPSIYGRQATEQDVKEGRAVFVVRGAASTALPMPLPQRAVLIEEAGEFDVVLIQAERAGEQSIVGYRMPEGGNGVATLEEFRLSEPPE